MITSAKRVVQVTETPNMGSAQENKRKQLDTEGSPEVTDPKRRITESGGTQTEDAPVVGSTPNEVTNRLFTELLGIKEMIGSVDAKVDRIETENIKWHQRMESVEKDLGEVKSSLEMAHNLINNEANARSAVVREVKTELSSRAKEITHSANVINSYGNDIKGIRDAMKSMECKFDKADECRKCDIQVCLGKLGQNNSSQEFPLKCTIVAQRVWCSGKDKNLDEIANTIIHKALNLSREEVQIVWTVRKSGWKTGSRLIKIEMGNHEQQQRVLKMKTELRKSRVKEIRDVYLRPSKSEEALMMERNVDTLLNEMGVCDEFVRLASGHLVKKGDYRGQRECGRGGSFSSRGARGGRPQRGTTWGRWQGDGQQRSGPQTGREDPRDARVAQALAREESRQCQNEDDISLETYMGS